MQKYTVVLASQSRCAKIASGSCSSPASHAFSQLSVSIKLSSLPHQSVLSKKSDKMIFSFVWRRILNEDNLGRQRPKQNQCSLFQILLAAHLKTMAIKCGRGEFLITHVRSRGGDENLMAGNSWHWFGNRVEVSQSRLACRVHVQFLQKAKLPQVKL